MTDWKFRPLPNWPYPDTQERSSRYRFKASWANTLDLLDRELVYLGADYAVVQADFREQDLRLDGLPRGNARQPEHPGVMISFESEYGPLTYATDQYEYWQHNVRAIALGLEALRAVDRYGVTHSGEQYRGWLQLTASDTAMERAQKLIDGYGGIAEAIRSTHPDRGGDPEAFRAVMDARNLLTGA